MRCDNCPYNGYDHHENYPVCKLFGIDDEFVYENSKGSIGCRFNRKTLKKYAYLKELEEQEICRQMGDFAKFLEEQDRRTNDWPEELEGLEQDYD